MKEVKSVKYKNDKEKIASPSVNFKVKDTSSKIALRIDHYKEKLLIGDHVDVFIPNKIFNDLISCSSFKNWSERAFAYTFYYLTSYLYRNCVYGRSVNFKDYGLDKIIKSLLGTSSRNFTHIYTRGGILDQLLYTKSINDYPINAVIEDKVLVDIETLSQAKQKNEENVHLQKIPSAFTVKVPMKGLYLNPYKTRKNKRLDGHFFDISDTHKIQVETFVACMTNSLLGYRGFYLYAFYRMHTDKFPTGYKATFKNIRNMIPLDRRSFQKYNNELSNMHLLKHKVIPHKPSTFIAKADLKTIVIK